jgi:hypothetical protein
MNREMMLAVKDRFSAIADLGDFLKRLSILPAWMSAPENFEGSQSTRRRLSAMNLGFPIAAIRDQQLSTHCGSSYQLIEVEHWPNFMLI